MFQNRPRITLGTRTLGGIVSSTLVVATILAVGMGIQWLRVDAEVARTERQSFSGSRTEADRFGVRLELSEESRAIAAELEQLIRASGGRVREVWMERDCYAVKRWRGLRACRVYSGDVWICVSTTVAARRPRGLLPTLSSRVSSEGAVYAKRLTEASVAASEGR